jgi:hypothetical protein
MMLFLLFMPLFAVVASSQPTQSPTSTSVAHPNDPLASAHGPRIPSLADSPQLQGGLGFTSLYYLLNRAAWSSLPSRGITLKEGISVVGLD